jgi:hypothetical protein
MFALIDLEVINKIIQDCENLNHQLFERSERLRNKLEDHDSTQYNYEFEQFQKFYLRTSKLLDRYQLILDSCLPGKEN